MCRIKIIDTHPGGGKTSAIIRYINEELEDEKHILYVTPLLTECNRIINACSKRKFKQPSYAHGKGSKSEDLKNLLENKANVVCSHALFQNLTDQTAELIKKGNYILIMDEVMNAIEMFDLYPDDTTLTTLEKSQIAKEDVTTLIEMCYCSYDENSGLLQRHLDLPDSANPQNYTYELSQYKTLEYAIDHELVYFPQKKYLVWMFPIEFFGDEYFSEVFLLTYQFESQIQRYYFDVHQIEYDYYTVVKTDNRYMIIPFDSTDETDILWRQEMQKLITIDDYPKHNAIGNADSMVYEEIDNPKIPLSKNWFNKSDEAMLKKLADNTQGFWRKYDAKQKNKMWTTFKDYAVKVKNLHETPSRFGSIPDLKKEISIKKINFVSLNTRATNDFSDRTHLAYLVNRFTHPYIKHFFNSYDMEFDQDAYALSEMIQWIWRSAIRNNEPIYIYIPSLRMRTLFRNWLYCSNPPDEKLAYEGYKKKTKDIHIYNEDE